MYTPTSFAVPDPRWARELIAEYPFALLITGSDGSSAQATHIPMLAEERDGRLWLMGHVARANPHARAIADNLTATAIFQGPHAYVSASWYEAPYSTVPTWNYAVVHAAGRLREGDARRTLELLTEAFESGNPDPWRMERLEAAYLERQLQGIKAFEMEVETLRATAKLSQNRTRGDRERVIAQLAGSPRELDRACAAAMQSQLDGETS